MLPSSNVAQSTRFNGVHLTARMRRATVAPFAFVGTDRSRYPLWAELLKRTLQIDVERGHRTQRKPIVSSAKRDRVKSRFVARTQDALPAYQLPPRLTIRPSVSLSLW
jgi:hypothetical protein